MYDYNNKKVLIVGGAGFIGSNLAHTLQAQYPSCEVVVFDSFRSHSMFANGNPRSLGHFKNLEGFKGEVIAGDINNELDLKALTKVSWDCIFLQAAISDTTVDDQHLVIKTNSNSLMFFIELALATDAHLVYASSAGTYGNSPAPNKVGFGEVPENVYGFSKLYMDHKAMSMYKSEPSLKVTGLRYFNVYGPGEFYKGKTASMILQLGIQMLKGERPRLFKFGEQKRDFVFINDVVQANLKAVGTKSGIFNVGSGVARSFNDVVSNLADALNVPVEVEFIDNPHKFYQNHTCADIAETKDRLSYAPQYTLESGIGAYRETIWTTFKQIVS